MHADCIPHQVLDAPDLSAVGPLGYLVANGQAAMLPRLKQLLQVGDLLYVQERLSEPDCA